KDPSGAEGAEQQHVDAVALLDLGAFARLQVGVTHDDRAFVGVHADFRVAVVAAAGEQGGTAGCQQDRRHDTHRTHARPPFATAGTARADRWRCYTDRAAAVLPSARWGEGSVSLSPLCPLGRGVGFTFSPLPACGER